MNSGRRKSVTLWSGIVTATVAAGLLIAGAAQAYTVEKIDFTITAIRDLTIGSKTYDVEFLYFDAGARGAYGNPPIFDFDNERDAKAAMDATLAVINSEGEIYGVGIEGAPMYKIGFEFGVWQDIDVPILDPFDLPYVLVWEGATDAEIPDGFWGIPPGDGGLNSPDVDPFVDIAIFAVFTETGSGGTGNSPPAADAGGPYEGGVGESIKFDGTGSRDNDDGIKNYTWDFGDDSPTVKGKKPEHVYASKGTYNVTLTVKDNGGKQSSDNTTAKIGQSGGAPIADAGGPYDGAVGKRVQFDGSDSTDPDGDIDTYTWDFGDGSNTKKGKKPEHRYDENGKYTVTLTVEDETGDTDTDTATATIGAGNRAPTADAGGPYEGEVDRVVEFDGSGSSDSDGEIEKYIWDFGDGSDTKRGRKPNHQYDEVGSYTVTVEVTDDGGKTDTDSSTVLIVNE